LEINTTVDEFAHRCRNAMKARERGRFSDDNCVVVPPDRRTWQRWRGCPAATQSSSHCCCCAYRRGEANRADWERDPFKLVEEGGFFYARGSSDDKAMAAVFADSMVRFKKGIARSALSSSR
jgi:hypothetical protein